MAHFKIIILDGALIKIEKWENDEKVAECGIDSERAISLWGPQQPLRTDYESWVALGKCPEYLVVEEYEGF